MDIFQLVKARKNDVAPELRSTLQDSRARVHRAVTMYNANFGLDGQPKTKLGRKLFSRYYYGGSTISMSIKVRLRWWLDRQLRKIFKFPVCAFCKGDVMDADVKVTELRRTVRFHIRCWRRYLKERFPDE